MAKAKVIKANDVLQSGGKLSNLTADDKEMLSRLYAQIAEKLNVENRKNQTLITDKIRQASELALANGYALIEDKKVYATVATQLAESVGQWTGLNSQLQVNHVYGVLQKAGMFSKMEKPVQVQPDVALEQDKKLGMTKK